MNQAPTRDELKSLKKENKRLRAENERLQARIELSRLKEIKLLSELVEIERQMNGPNQ